MGISHDIDAILHSLSGALACSKSGENPYGACRFIDEISVHNININSLFHEGTNIVSIEQFTYYYVLRRLARERVANAINARILKHGGREKWDRITLASIKKNALDVARLRWPLYYGPHTHEGFMHGWDTLYQKFACRPSFFDIAVWQTVGDEEILQGLALGKPSNGKRHLTLNWIERSFAPTYYKRRHTGSRSCKRGRICETYRLRARFDKGSS